MIDLIVTTQIYLLAVVALMQPNAPRFVAAVSFAGIRLVHELFFAEDTDIAYYGTSALFDLAIIIVTWRLRPVTQLVITLQRICRVSIVANTVGWALWFKYYPPLVYGLTFIAIYTWALITLVKRGPKDVGAYSLDSWTACIRGDNSARSTPMHKYGGTT